MPLHQRKKFLLMFLSSVDVARLFQTHTPSSVAGKGMNQSQDSNYSQAGGSMIWQTSSSFKITLRGSSMAYNAPSCVFYSWNEGSFYALLAGFLGAAASLSAKLSLGANYLREMCESWPSGWSETPGGSTACDWLHIPLRLLCGGLLFTCNAVMWTFFSKALRHCSSSARATVTTTASNFISSGLLGRLFFGEAHAALWWVGISLTLCGLLVLHGSTPQTHPREEDKKEK